MPYQDRSRKGRGGQNKRAHNNNSSAPRRHAPTKRTRNVATIDPNKFVNKASDKQASPVYVAKHQFVDFPFSKELQDNIAKKGYRTPSAIQDQTIGHILKGKDVIGLANTGTGKTAAFLLPTIDKLLKDKRPFSTIILAPTRELAQQIDEQFSAFSSGLGLRSVQLVGGSNIGRQMAILRRKPHVIIATPGRLMDLIARKEVPLQGVKTLILDEADRMLDMGFVNDIRKIVLGLPEDRQTLFFSATITPRVNQLTKEFLRDPETVSVVTASTSEHVDQNVIEVGPQDDKMDKLFSLLGDDSLDKVLIFGKTKYGVQRLSDNLCKRDIGSVAIHGNKSQSQRQRALKTFKDGEARIMVATDVAARGLDIPNVSHVINFDQPATYEDYVHRIGRTGRGDATGIAWTFVEKCK